MDVTEAMSPMSGTICNQLGVFLNHVCRIPLSMVTQGSAEKPAQPKNHTANTNASLEPSSIQPHLRLFRLNFIPTALSKHISKFTKIFSAIRAVSMSKDLA